MTDWNKPRNAWQWLALLSPAMAAVVACQIAVWWLPPLPPIRLPNGELMANVWVHAERLAVLAVEIMTPLSICIGVILARGKNFWQRAANSIVFALCLFFVNSAIAFAGCTLSGASGPTHAEIEGVK